MREAAEEIVGAPADAIDDMTWHDIMAIEQAAVPEGTPGWHKGYDAEKGAAWLWNDNPEAPEYLDFITYESTESLAAKLDYIKANGLGGLIIWEVHGDSIDNDWPMITQMHKGLHP